MTEKLNATDLVATLKDATVVLAIWPDGNRGVLAGKDILERVVESGQSITPVLPAPQAINHSNAGSAVRSNGFGALPELQRDRGFPIDRC